MIDILRGDSIDDEAEFFAWLGGQKMTLEEEDKELEAYFREQREAEMQAQSAGK